MHVDLLPDIIIKKWKGFVGIGWCLVSQWGLINIILPGNKIFTKLKL